MDFVLVLFLTLCAAYILVRKSTFNLCPLKEQCVPICTWSEFCSQIQNTVLKILVTFLFGGADFTDFFLPFCHFMETVCDMSTDVHSYLTGLVCVLP